jgi:hypothetical protein
MTWHADPETLHGYAQGHISPVQASSVEAHLLACDVCRSSLAAGVDQVRLDALWGEITAAADAPVPGTMERLLGRLGVPEHVGRLLAATPALRLSWLAAVVVTLALAVSAARRGDGDIGLVLFLVLAPLLPLAGVAASFGPGIDPVYEVAVAAPLRSFDLLLVRATAVLATTTGLAGAAAATVPHADWQMAAWLLPAFGLTAGSLALSTWVTPWKASAALASVWVGAAALALRLSAGAPPGASLVERFVAFRPSGQVALAAFTVAAAVIVALRRDAFEIGRTV